MSSASVNRAVNITRPEDATLVSKGALGAKAIAEDILGRDIGEHLPPISRYADALTVGTGTIQAALGHLREIGAVEFQPKGHLGTVLVARDLPKLWRLARDRPVHGLLPMPYSRVYEGLSTGIRELLRRSQVGVSFTHANGSRSRLQALVDGAGEYDFAITSRLAYDIAQELGLPIALAASFGRGSFVREHVIFTRRGDAPAVVPGMTVGVDPASLDQPFIVRLLCADTPVTYRDVGYFDFEKRLLEGRIDLIVWSGDDSMNINSPGLTRSVLPSGVLRELRGRNSEAVAVVRAADRGSAALLREQIDPNLVRKIQAQVVRGLRVASY